MNKERRKKLHNVFSLLEDCLSVLEEVCDEEEEAFNNMPESFQCSERGEHMEDIISEICDLIDSIDYENLAALIEE